MQDIDQRDRELLNALQSDLPLVSTPYAVLGQMIDMSEKEVIKRAEKLKREGLLRQISASYDTRALGYRSTLVAAQVGDERMDHAAAIINLHPGVTQNYRRNHQFNLWYTLAVPPNSKLGLEKTVKLLEEEAGCKLSRMLPTLKQYRNSANADAVEFSSDGNLDFGQEAPGQPELTEREIESIKLLQKDLPLQPRPWETLARTVGMAGEELLETTRLLFKRQQIRRIGGSIPSRKAGFSATVMGVWEVPLPAQEELAARMVTYPAISHSYLRPVYADWPYNLFTTVHGRSVDECEAALNEIASDTGITNMKALYPIKEYKRAGIVLFSAEMEEWEAARLGSLRSAAS